MTTETRTAKSLCIIAYTDYHADARVIRQAESAYGAGYEVTVITPMDRGEKRTMTVNRIALQRLRVRHYGGSVRAGYVLSYLLFFVLCFIRLTLLNLKYGFRIVQVCNMPDFLVFSTMIAKLSGAKIILDIHDPMPETYLAKFPSAKRGLVYQLLLLLEKASAAYADRVMTVHEPVKRDVLVKDGIDGSKISVVANFPDGDIFSVRRDVLHNPPVRLIYYGTIAARFGFKEVLSAIRGVRRVDMLRLKIIGKGDYETRLRGLIGTMGLERTVDFENKIYPLRQLPDIVCQYHLGLVPYVLSPATDYMLPVKLLELLAMGIPSITISNAAIRHYVDESLYFSYNPGDLSSLTRLLDHIIENPSVIPMKRNAILKHPRRLLWEDERGKYLRLLNLLGT